MNRLNETVGVLLMTYGSPATLDDVPAYLSNVRGGRPAPEELILEFRRRYQIIGGSPLLSISKAQAGSLGNELMRRWADGRRCSVDVGMRFAPPLVADAVTSLSEQGVDRLVGIIMSPQYSPIIMGGYELALQQAVGRLGRSLPFAVAGAWHRQPRFIEALALQLRLALDDYAPGVREFVKVLFSAHSMPKRVVDREPDYVEQLHETALAVAVLVGLPSHQWMFCYQSAGHSPEPWLKPDFADIMPQLAGDGASHVLIAPVQFLADHLEILYDIEIGAREQAERFGIAFARTASLNTSPLLIAALADVVEQELANRPGRALADKRQTIDRIR